MLKTPRKTVDRYSKVVEPEEFKRMVFEQVNVDAIDVYLNRVLCAVYLTNERTPGGIIKPTEVQTEDIWQGKPALVLKVGPAAFMDADGYSWMGQKVNPGDWVTFKIGNCSQIEINDFPCRIVKDSFIESRVWDPRQVTS